MTTEPTGAAGATLCSLLPHETTESFHSVRVDIDARGLASPEEGPPVERGIPFAVSVHVDDAPELDVIEAQGAELVVRDADGTELFRTHGIIDPEDWRDIRVVEFDPAPCYLGASYDLDYGSQSIPLRIQVSDAAACSDRPTEDGDEWGILQVRDDVLWEGDWELGPQPFAVMVSWYPPPADLRPEDTSVVVRVDGDVVERVRGWPHNEQGSTAIWFEQIPCILDAEYTLEYPGQALQWRPRLVE